MRLLHFSALILFVQALSATSAGADPARDIAEAVDRLDQGFESLQANVTMKLVNKNGGVVIRQFTLQSFEVTAENRGDLSRIEFYEPRDVAGTVLLTHSRVLDPNDQWLYLPALRRTRRISSSNQSGSFLGSEFAYEDLAAPHIDRYAYESGGKTPCGEDECDVLIRTPLYENSGYTKQNVWVDSLSRVAKIEYFDRKSEHIKTLTFRNFQRFDDRFWRALDLTMENHISGKSTHLEWRNVHYRAGLIESDFDVSRLSE